MTSLNIVAIFVVSTLVGLSYTNIGLGMGDFATHAFDQDEVRKTLLQLRER